MSSKQVYMGLKSQMPVIDKSKIQFNFGGIQNPRPINLPPQTSIPSTPCNGWDTKSVMSTNMKIKKKKTMRSKKASNIFKVGKEVNKIDKDVNQLKHDLSSASSVSKESSKSLISERHIT